MFCIPELRAPVSPKYFDFCREIPVRNCEIAKLRFCEIAPGVTSEKKSGPPQDAREKKTVAGLPTSLTKKTRKVEQFPFFIYVLRGSRFTTILTSAFPEVDGVFCEFSYFDERRNPTAISQFAYSFVAQI